MPSKKFRGKKPVFADLISGETGLGLLGGGISHPCGLPSPPVLLQIPGSGLCRMQEKASETFLSKIEQGLPFLSKLLPGRSRPLPAPLRPLALCTLTPSHEGPAWPFPGLCGHRSFLGSSSHLSCWWLRTWSQKVQGSTRERWKCDDL